MSNSQAAPAGVVVISPTAFATLPPCLTVKEAAARLGHKPRWVRQQLRARQIPILLAGAKILIPDAHLSMFFDAALGTNPKNP